MEIRQLRYLLAISKEQNINRAAKLCFVTQPALTQQIQKLEAEFNTSLLIRNGRGVTLSEDGEKLTRHAQQLIKKIDEIKKDFTRRDSNSIHQINVGVNPCLYKSLSSRILLQQEGLSININLKKMKDEQIKHELKRGIINAGIAEDIGVLNGMNNDLVAREPMFLVSSYENRLNQNQSISIRDILAEPMMVFHEKHALRKYLDSYLESEGFEASLKIAVNSLDEMISAVKSSNFVSVLPLRMIKRIESTDRINVKRIEGFFQDHHLYWNDDSLSRDKRSSIKAIFQQPIEM